MANCKRIFGSEWYSFRKHLNIEHNFPLHAKSYSDSSNKLSDESVCNSNQFEDPMEINITPGKEFLK